MPNETENGKRGELSLTFLVHRPSDMTNLLILQASLILTNKSRVTAYELKAYISNCVARHLCDLIVDFMTKPDKVNSEIMHKSSDPVLK